MVARIYKFQRTGRERFNHARLPGDAFKAQTPRAGRVRLLVEMHRSKFYRVAQFRIAKGRCCHHTLKCSFTTLSESASIVPEYTMRPRFMIENESPNSFTKSRYCSTSTMAMSPRWLSLRSTAPICFMIDGWMPSVDHKAD